ncbi:MAG: hypothetical protein KKD01_20275 [Proteobacteria bacterium]|nr:hypothetical protein [Pseudomonadota bacterium]
MNVERGLKHWWGTYSNLLAFEHVYGPFCWVSFPSRNGMLQLWKALGVPPDTVTNGFKAEKVHYTEEAVPKGYEPLMQLHKSLEARIERGNDTL